MTITIAFQILVPILLAINAYFIKGLMDSITNVRIKMEGIVERGTSSNIAMLELKSEVKELHAYMLNNKERLHSLEGASVNIQAYFEEVLRRTKD